MQLAYVFLGYFLGSMLFGYRITWLLKGVDIRKLAEDENPGTYNAFVFGGFWCGILTLLADMGKGYLPVILYRQNYGTEELIFALVMAAPVFGHAFSIFHGRKGGKGIAVSFGSLLGLIPMWYPVLSLAVCFLFFSLVIQISPNFYRTVAVYIVNWLIIVFSETNLPKAVHIGVGLISLLILLKMHMSQEEREKMTFQLLWIKR